MSLLHTLFRTKVQMYGPQLPGLYHYVCEGQQEKSRVHLRLDADGHGTLIVNANRVMHLNPTAALMAYLTLEKTGERQAVAAIQKQYRVTTSQARTDLAAIGAQIAELVRPDGACPIHEMDLEMSMPFSARPSAPYRMDLALTYRCSNDCPHCYNARSRDYPELDTESWKRILDKLWDLGVPHIVFTGGEPTLRNVLPELIAYAQSKGQITGLNTNARRLQSHDYMQ